MATTPKPGKSSLMHRNPAMVFSLIALALVALIVAGLWYWLNINLYWMWLAAVNGVAIILYRFDKRRAARQNGRARVPEMVLLGLMWLGGVVGAGLGMYLRPRHKTKKMRFVLSLVIASIMHAGLLIWWLA